MNTPHKKGKCEAVGRDGVGTRSVEVCFTDIIKYKRNIINVTPMYITGFQSYLKQTGKLDKSLVKHEFKLVPT